MPAADVHAIGNLTRDPELKFTNSGTERLNFSIACNETWTDQSGEKQERTSFIDCTMWGKSAAHAAELLDKGSKVMVSGRLEQVSWEDAETGQKRSKIQLKVLDLGIHTNSIDSFTRRRYDDNGNGNGRSNGNGHERRPANARRPVPERTAPASSPFDEDDFDF